MRQSLLLMQKKKKVGLRKRGAPKIEYIDGEHMKIKLTNKFVLVVERQQCSSYFRTVLKSSKIIK